MKGLDLSHWNQPFNFRAAKEAGIEFVILKAGGSDRGFYKDRCFDRFYEDAKQAGLNVGAYYFTGSKFLGDAAGRADAERFYRICQGKIFEMPLYCDIEKVPAGKNYQASQAAVAFGSYLESKNCFAGIYASDISGFRDRLHLPMLRRFTLWVARYGSSPAYVNGYAMWQYTDRGRLPNDPRRFDFDECYQDFPAIMKRKGLNYCK